MQFTLRPASAADYPWLWSLKRLTMRKYVEETWGAWDDAAQEAFFRRTYRSETIQVLVVDGTNAGLLHLEREPAAIFLANIQIHPDFQNRGLGTAVIRDVLISARTLGLPVRLQVLQVNIAARQLYQRLGFRVSGETPTHVQMLWQP
jgi:ribosomal protein S18 acetylase RimI-like enzyme